MSTAVIALKATDSIARLREEMELAHIRHIPVVDEHNRILGIVSDRDLSRVKRSHRRIADIMTQPVRTVRPDTPASTAAMILLSEKIGSLPVIGEDEQLVGVITESDFLTVAHDALRGLAPAERAPA